MSAYIQMGHDTQNLVGEKDLNFSGIILSPVNRPPEKLIDDFKSFKNKRADYEIILDPQLYIPKSNRGALSRHPYFPSDMDTADPASLKWWTNTCDQILKYARDMGVKSIISPVLFPKIWDVEYFGMSSQITDYMCANATEKIYATVLVNMADLTSEKKMMQILSIATTPSTNNFYILFVNNIDPRRELTDVDEIYSAMKFISLLKEAGKNVLVGCCSSEMILYKAAGADHCASGKYFNLRRFTPSRFDDQADSGGKVISYWFEHGILGFLREPDILRLLEEDKRHLLMQGGTDNIWSNKILEILESGSGRPWVAESWRQYLAWFSITEATYSANNSLSVIRAHLKQAEAIWEELNDEDILFDEPKNDGRWIRPWRQALAKFEKSQQ